MVSRDPKKAIETLRDHLASHDKPLAFLMGAGTSCAVKVLVRARRVAGEQEAIDHGRRRVPCRM